MQQDYSDRLGRVTEEGRVLPLKDVIGNQVIVSSPDTLGIGGGYIVCLPIGYKPEEVEPIIRAVAASVGVQWGEQPDVPPPVPLTTIDELQAPIVGVKNPYDEGDNEQELPPYDDPPIVEDVMRDE